MNRNQFYDVIVIGGGPAGLTAAIYLARADYRVLVIEKEHFGGLVTITNEIVNYPGVIKASGKELTETMRRQAEGFGAEFLLTEVTDVKVDSDIKAVKTHRGDLYCFGLLFATGAHPRSVGFLGEEEFRGRGVSYCATCDGSLFTGKEIFVIGGGYTAAEESVFLTRYAKHVTILIRGSDFRCPESLSRPAASHSKISVLTHTEVIEIKGDTLARSIRYRNVKTGEEVLFAPKDDYIGVFVFAGYEPETRLVKGKVRTDRHGYIVTDNNQKTNVDGVYAAGDVCVKNLRQIVTAAGSGATAATELEEYATTMQAKTGLKPKRPEIKQGQEEAEQKVEDVFSSEEIKQIRTLLSKIQSPLILELSLDGRPVSEDLRIYMLELASLSPELSVTTVKENDKYAPYVRVRFANGKDSGIVFHGAPGGHEFMPFVLALYNVAGPGQSLDRITLKQIRAIDRRVNMKIFVTLTCGFCPDLVIAAQHIAALNKNVTAEVYDIKYFPEFREKYNVVSVPCLVINDKNVFIGRRTITQLLGII